MAEAPAEFSLELTPDARVDVIDVKARIQETYGDVLAPYSRAAYCSFHTTAGFFEQSLCTRLGNDRDSVHAFVQSFQHLFPPDADYKHDQLDLRLELSEAQRCVEPRNADSHLTFIGSGLENFVTYQNQPDAPVYFVELDGVNDNDDNSKRTRRTRVIGFNAAEVVDQTQFAVPVSEHRMDSINLADPRLGLFDALNDHLERLDLTKGRIELTLDPAERNTGLTMNEYETLLMQHDLAEVLGNPLRFMAEKGKNMLRDPRAIPAKAKNYAKYDLVHVVNQFIDALGLNESLVERIIDKFFAMPAQRFLRMKRSLNLLVTDQQVQDHSEIVRGTYQSPILVQWKRAHNQTRRINIQFIRFD